MRRQLITLMAVAAFAANEPGGTLLPRAGLSRFSVGVEQVGDTLPESGQDTDWAKSHPPATSIYLPRGSPQRAS
jgi:hypothetical protein